MTKIILGNLDLIKIGDRLRKVDRFLLDILSVRLAHGGLSDYVAECKRKESKAGYYDNLRKKKEKERIGSMKRWAKEMGLDPNFAASLMYQMISESCRVQSSEMVIKLKKREGKIDEKNPDIVYSYQRRNLLELTAAIAPFYTKNYAQDFFGSMRYFQFEKEILGKLTATLEDHSLAIDLGCATGVISSYLSPTFEKIIGYDISPKMIVEANKNVGSDKKNLYFENADIEEDLNLQENSVSLAIMNMGTCSDIRNIEKVLECLRKALSPDGKFFLSFYNSESLLSKIGFLPWPMQLAAHIDQEKRCLEVHYGNEIYLLYARPRNMEEVESLLNKFGLVIEEYFTYPTLASILPNIILEKEDKPGTKEPNKEVQKLIEMIDSELATSPLNCGTYIIVTGRKNV